MRKVLEMLLAVTIVASTLGNYSVGRSASASEFKSHTDFGNASAGMITDKYVKSLGAKVMYEDEYLLANFNVVSADSSIEPISFEYKIGGKICGSVEDISKVDENMYLGELCMSTSLHGIVSVKYRVKYLYNDDICYSDWRVAYALETPNLNLEATEKTLTEHTVHLQFNHIEGVKYYDVYVGKRKLKKAPSDSFEVRGTNFKKGVYITLVANGKIKGSKVKSCKSEYFLKFVKNK